MLFLNRLRNVYQQDFQHEICVKIFLNGVFKAFLSEVYLCMWFLKHIFRTSDATDIVSQVKADVGLHDVLIYLLKVFQCIAQIHIYKNRPKIEHQVCNILEKQKLADLVKIKVAIVFILIWLFTHFHKDQAMK